MNPDWMKNVFDYIYVNNKWHNEESISGPGSSLHNTAAIRRCLPDLLKELDIRVLLDIPCGDFYWMKEMDLNLDRYIGADIVADMTRSNTERYADPETGRWQFLTLDITKDPLPDADLVFCRDCLVHFSIEDIHRALNNIRRSGARYLLTTTFTNRTSNPDITTGQWRPLNLLADPFRLPAPMRLLSEEYTGSRGQYPDKQLGLWEIASLRSQ